MWAEFQLTSLPSQMESCLNVINNIGLVPFAAVVWRVTQRENGTHHLSFKDQQGFVAFKPVNSVTRSRS